MSGAAWLAGGLLGILGWFAGSWAGEALFGHPAATFAFAFTLAVLGFALGTLAVKVRAVRRRSP